jgi:divalent metal cation (Fe/Co/Zn/Cd) transporter
MPAKPSALLDTRVIYCGDNLDQLGKLPEASVDLIYIDPPFNSNRNYEVFWGETKEKRSFEDEKREQLALKLVGISFFVLAAYVAVDAAKTLVQREPPHASIVGVCLAAVSIVVMPLLARAKRRVAARLNSRALVADSRQTDLCAYLSGILFVGLALNALFGWWWADSIAAILMVPIITREGIEALRGDACDNCS